MRSQYLTIVNWKRIPSIQASSSTTSDTFDLSSINSRFPRLFIYVPINADFSLKGYGFSPALLPLHND